jgi:hypothetical protein
VVDERVNGGRARRAKGSAARSQQCSEMEDAEGKTDAESHGSHVVVRQSWAVRAVAVAWSSVQRTGISLIECVDR